MSLLPIASFHSLEGPHCGRGRIGSGFLNANLTSEVNDKWLPGSEGQFHTAKVGGDADPAGTLYLLVVPVSLLCVCLARVEGLRMYSRPISFRRGLCALLPEVLSEDEYLWER